MSSLLREYIASLLTEAPLNLQNEIALESRVNKEVARAGGPIGVSFGNVIIKGVRGATRTGGSAKADVTLDTVAGPYGVSIKLPSADYWLSGDREIAPYLEGIMSTLRSKGSSPRVEALPGRDEWVMVGDGGVRLKKIWCELMGDPEGEALGELAVFGRGGEVNVVAKGSFLDPPMWNPVKRFLRWDGISTWESLDELPRELQPVLILRRSGGSVSRPDAPLRGFSTGGVRYRGLRPVVGVRKFAERARDAVKIEF
jgi:hypothetical protein